MDDFALVSRPEYFAALTQLVDQTKHGDRIAIASMTFDSREPLIDNLMRSLCQAAQRGAEVYLLVDAYIFLALDGKVLPGPLWGRPAVPQKLAEPYRSWRASLQELKKAGGAVAITNIPPKQFSTPYAGRSHIKAAVINDYIFLGGCNLQNPEHTDIMVGRTHTQSADWVYKWLTKIAETSSTRTTFADQDRHLQCDDGTEIIIDAGVPKQSAIYDQALQLIDEAREQIYLTCQFFPGGETGQRLLAAYKRGVDVRILYSHALSHSNKSLGHLLYNSRERLRLPAAFFAEGRSPRAPLLHAKVLVTEQATMVGSHNYVGQGVWLGTAEIALLSHDSIFGQKIIRKIGSQL